MKSQKGITLIALIITIIVLSILAAVGIKAATDKNGIIKEAFKTSEDKEIADEEEQVKVGYMSTAMENYGLGTSVDKLQAELDGTVGVGKTEVIEDRGKLKVKFIDTGRVYVAGDVYTGGGTWDSILSKLEHNPNSYKHSAQSSTEYIGVGTDRMPVNMDLWHCYKTDDEQGMSLGKGDTSFGQVGYDEINLIDGKIQGKMPQYIYVVAESKIYPVVSLHSTFGYTSIKEVPEIPTTVKSLYYTFYSCDELIDAAIPGSITSIGSEVFSYCTELTSIIIPNNITNIGYGAFSGCTKLSNIIIHNTVTSIEGYAFSGCNVLTNIYYTGTQAQWNAISKDEGNAILNLATITYNYGN